MKAAPKPIPIPSELRPESDEYKALEEFAGAVRRCDAIAQRLVLRGIFCIDDPAPLFASFEAVAQHEGDYGKVQKTVARLLKVIEAADLDAAQQKALADLGDAIFHGCQSFGEAGYLLGIAVGQRVNTVADQTGGVR